MAATKKVKAEKLGFKIVRAFSITIKGKNRTFGPGDEDDALYELDLNLIQRMMGQGNITAKNPRPTVPAPALGIAKED